MKRWAVILLLCFSLSCLAQTNTNSVVLPSSQLVSNIVTLSQNKVSDKVIIEFIRAQKETPKIVTNAPVRQVDVEGYDFFYWNYLYPRTLRYRYDTLYHRRY